MDDRDIYDPESRTPDELRLQYQYDLEDMGIDAYTAELMAWQLKNF